MIRYYNLPKEERHRIFQEEMEKAGMTVDGKNHVITYKGEELALCIAWSRWLEDHWGPERIKGLIIEKIEEKNRKEEKERKKEATIQKAKKAIIGLGISPESINGVSSDAYPYYFEIFIDVPNSYNVTAEVRGESICFIAANRKFKDFKRAADFSRKARAKGEEEARREKEKEEIRKAFWNQSDDEIFKCIKENLNMLSDESITSGSCVGGYDGYSMSNSARASEEAGSLPMSKWTKKEILAQIEEHTHELNPFIFILEKCKKADLVEICLESDGWHHTSKYYNKTEFYCIQSPRDVVRELIKRGLI